MKGFISRKKVIAEANKVIYKLRKENDRRKKEDLDSSGIPYPSCDIKPLKHIQLSPKNKKEVQS